MKIVFDSSYVAYRAAFGMGELSWNQQQVQVVFDFLRQILKTAEDFHCRDFVFCFDSKESWRKVYFPDYKKSRGEKKVDFDLADFHRQLDDIRKVVLPYMGFQNIFQQNGYEGDDIVASVVENNGGEFIVVANDEDLFQILKEGVGLYNFKRVYRLEDYRRDFFEISPEDWRRVKAIAGCSGDGVIGLEKVGDKTAAKYLAGKLSEGKIKDKIQSPQGQAMASFNLPLVSIPYQGPKRLRPCCLSPDKLSPEGFQMIMKQYGFNFFLKNWERWEKAFF